MYLRRHVFHFKTARKICENKCEHVPDLFLVDITSYNEFPQDCEHYFIADSGQLKKQPSIIIKRIQIKIRIKGSCRRDKEIKMTGGRCRIKLEVGRDGCDATTLRARPPRLTVQGRCNLH